MNKKELIEILDSMGYEGVADAVAEQVADNFTKASNEVIGIMCDALRENSELIPSDAIKLMNVMKKRDLKQINNILASASDKSLEEIDNMLEVLAQDNDNFAQALFDYKGKESTSYKDDDMLKSILKTSADSMKEDIINISKTSAITVNGNSIAIDKAYIKVLNQGIYATQQGYTDFNTAVRQVVKKMAADGVRSVTFSNGSKRRLDSQARMNILEGVKRFNYNYRMAKGEQYGSDGVEIDVHFPCAPDHIPYQGKQYNNKEFEKLQNSLSRPIGDMNCRHSVTPIVLGVSEPAYSDEEIEKAKTLSEDIVSYYDSRGILRKCTGYEATQIQRRMELKVRRLKDQQEALKRVGDDITAREVGKKVAEAKKEYYRICESFVSLEEIGLRARNNRLGYSGYIGGNVAKDRLGWISNNTKSNPRYYDFKGKNMNTVEKEISKFDYEVAVIFDKEKPISCQLQRGEKHEVIFTKSQLRMMKGRDVTHNHPWSTPPSPEDLYLLIDYKAKSFRATGENGTYVLKYGKYVKDMPTYDVFSKEYDDIYDSLVEKYLEKVKKDKISNKKAEIMIQEEIWDILNKKYNIGMYFERR